MQVEQAIESRRTIKVLAEEALPAESHRSEVTALLESAGWAPFHRACDSIHREGSDASEDGPARLTGIEPWRFHALDAAECRQLVGFLSSEKAGKIPSMLRSADSMIMATWLPNPPNAQHTLEAGHLFEPTLGNMEHIAAASAAIQNLLLAATSKGIPNYWSSGGVLRETSVYEKLGISQHEILLGAIFLFPRQFELPADSTLAPNPSSTMDSQSPVSNSLSNSLSTSVNGGNGDNAEVVGSKLRDKRSDLEGYCRWVSLT